MKKFLNDPQHAVTETLAGFARAHSDRVHVDPEQGFVRRSDAAAPEHSASTDPDSGPNAKVALVSGGGSGHEPLHAGFVGYGMLDAACPGPVFTSPVPDQVAAATRAVDQGAGVLHIVKNYTGDVMNFEMAAELVAADGGQVASVVVADDVAVEDSLHTAGRRGTGLTVLLEKIVGAAAEEGQDLQQCQALAQRIADSGRSFAIALTSCTVPAAGEPMFELGPDEIEMGVGIHGEPGRERSTMAPAATMAERLVEPVMNEIISGTDSPSEAIVLVNGLGGTPLMELYVMYDHIAGLLEKSGTQVVRCLVGNYITSLDMAGCSLTVLPATEEIVRLWDAPVNTPALRWGV